MRFKITSLYLGGEKNCFSCSKIRMFIIFKEVKMDSKRKYCANPYQFSSNYEGINQLQVLLLYELAVGSLPSFPLEGRTKDYLHLQRQRRRRLHTPKKGIFEKFLNSFLCFFSMLFQTNFLFCPTAPCWQLLLWGLSLVLRRQAGRPTVACLADASPVPKLETECLISIL